MNILFVSQRVPYPPNKGEKIRTYNQMRYLKQQGHSLHLISPQESTSEQGYFDVLKDSLCDSVTSHPASSKLARLSMGFIRNQPLSVANFYSKVLQHKFDALLQKYHFDAIVCCASSVAQYVYQSEVIGKASPQVRLIMDFMDVDSDKWAQYASNSRFPFNLIYRREQKLLSRYEKHIANTFEVSYLIAEAEVKLFREKVSDNENVKVLGNGLDTKAFYPPTDKRQNPAPVLLFTGVMDYKPNIDAVVWFVNNCWAQILEKYSAAKFIIAGMNPTSEVSSLVKHRGIEVTGFVEDILPFYHQADIFVAPFQLARGVQNKVLQAFSCKLPVVTTSMGAEGINCQDEKEFLLANTAEEFINQISRLYSDTNFAEKISDRALDLISTQYSWEGQLTPLGKLFEKE